MLVINDDAAASIKYEDDLATDSSCFHLVVVQVMANDAGRRADVDVRVCPAFALDGPWCRNIARMPRGTAIPDHAVTCSAARGSVRLPRNTSNAVAAAAISANRQAARKICVGGKPSANR